MTASLGASLLFILAFFTGLAVMLVLAVHMEATLQERRPRPRPVRVSVRRQRIPAVVSSTEAGRDQGA